MNKIVENALAAHRAKNEDATEKKVANMITSKQYGAISKILGDAQRGIDKCDYACKTILLAFDDISRGLAEMSRGYDEEAAKDARFIEIPLKNARDRVDGLVKILSQAIDKMADKYSTYDAKRLID